jgi:hypothetical protein
VLAESTVEKLTKGTMVQLALDGDRLAIVQRTPQVAVVVLDEPTVEICDEMFIRIEGGNGARLALDWVDGPKARETVQILEEVRVRNVDTPPGDQVGSTPPDKRFCSYCGDALAGPVLFCGSCGKPVAGIVSGPTASASAVPDVAPTKKGDAAQWIVCIILLAAIIGAGAFVWYEQQPPALSDAASQWCGRIDNYGLLHDAALTLGIDDVTLITVQHDGVYPYPNPSEKQRADYVRACNAAFGSR